MKRAIFVHALHKSATMFLYKFFKHYAKQARIKYYSPNNEKVNKLDDLNENETNFCCCPVRQFAKHYQGHTYKEITKLVLNYNSPETYRIYHIRDPRDLLVSQYFSVAYIHALHEKLTVEQREKYQKMTVDDFCMKWADQTLERYESIFTVTAKRKLIVKYEQMVLDYSKWLSKIASFLSIPPEIKRDLRRKFKREFIPPIKERMKHKRKMIPGDYKEKLKPSTIKQLDSKFSQILEAFYPNT